MNGAVIDRQHDKKRHRANPIQHDCEIDPADRAVGYDRWRDKRMRAAPFLDYEKDQRHSGGTAQCGGDPSIACARLGNCHECTDEDRQQEDARDIELKRRSRQVPVR